MSTVCGNCMPKTVSNTFDKFNIEIAFKTTDNISNIVRTKQPKPLEGKTGVFKIICDDCNSFYLSQTVRPFVKGLREHLPKRDIEKLNPIIPSFNCK